MFPPLITTLVFPVITPTLLPPYTFSFIVPPAIVILVLPVIVPVLLPPYMLFHVPPFISID